jgi:hypothetical protein
MAADFDFADELLEDFGEPGAIGYDGASYDMFRHPETLELVYDPAGAHEALVLPVDVFVADFPGGPPVRWATCTVDAQTYRIAKVRVSSNKETYRLSLVDEFPEDGGG